MVFIFRARGPNQSGSASVEPKAAAQSDSSGRSGRGKVVPVFGAIVMGALINPAEENESRAIRQSRFEFAQWRPQHSLGN